MHFIGLWPLAGWLVGCFAGLSIGHWFFLFLPFLHIWFYGLFYLHWTALWMQPWPQGRLAIAQKRPQFMATDYFILFSFLFFFSFLFDLTIFCAVSMIVFYGIASLAPLRASKRFFCTASINHLPAVNLSVTQIMFGLIGKKPAAFAHNIRRWLRFANERSWECV